MIETILTVFKIGLKALFWFIFGLLALLIFGASLKLLDWLLTKISDIFDERR